MPVARLEPSRLSCELTPCTGEVFMDRHIFNKFQFIEDRPKVEAYRFFTNFTIPNRTNIKRLPRLNKLKNLTVSIYGHDLPSFIAIRKSTEKVYNGPGREFLPNHSEARSQLRVIFDRDEVSRRSRHVGCTLQSGSKRADWFVQDHYFRAHVRSASRELSLEHDPQKWKPAFRKDHALR